MNLQKPTKAKPNKEYREWLLTKGCMVCKTRAYPHHLNTGGMGTRGSDEFNIIPLCVQHHTFGIHMTTERLFESRYDLKHLRSVAIILSVDYFQEPDKVLADVRGISIIEARDIIYTATRNIENDTRRWVG